MNGELTFRDYQRQAARTDRARGGELASMMIPLLGLAGEAGSLLSEYKKWLREGSRYKPFTDQVSEEIGDILWYLASIAGRAGLDLQEIAEENLAKLADRYAPAGHEGPILFPRRRYDDDFPETEKLPTVIRVEFREQHVDGVAKLFTTCNERKFGDALTDNAHVRDGYRFHDVFHFANAVVLGWSPVVRSLLKVKRKSVPHIDEVEDGARAKVTEEAISAFVFGYARDYSFFENATSVEFGLLRTIKLMTRPFEVREKSLRDWEQSILQGYDVWRKMLKNGGGVLVGNAVDQSVRFESLSPEAPTDAAMPPACAPGRPRSGTETDTE